MEAGGGGGLKVGRCGEAVASARSHTTKREEEVGSGEEEKGGRERR
jgi:hypothetical protein